MRTGARPLVLAGAAWLAAVPAHAQRACAPVAPVRAESHAWAPPLDRRVTLSAHDAALGDVVDRLAAAGGARVAYAWDLLPLDRRVCVSARAQPLGEVLAALVGPLGLAPTSLGGQVVLVRIAGEPRAERDHVDVLDRIVVTGSATGSSRRALTIAMDAVEGEELARRSSYGPAQVLNASVPGVWAWSGAASSLAVRYGSVRGASSFGATYPKVYLDGIAVANPLLAPEIDPATVERVEVIRGPQGAALYGSDAISGVVNIVTRHRGGEGSGTRAEVSSWGGVAASEFAAAPLPAFRHQVSMRTGSGVRTGGLTVTAAGNRGAYPGADSRGIAAVADGRWVTGAVVAALAVRVSDRRTGAGRSPLLDAPSDSAGSAPEEPVEQSLRRHTVSASATVAGGPRWTHRVVAGVDGYRLTHMDPDAGTFRIGLDSVTSSDPALRTESGDADRATLRAGSTLRLGGEEAAGPRTVMVTVEHSVLRRRSAGPGAALPAAAEWRHSTGVVAQTSLAWGDRLFGTGGVRVERNDEFTRGGAVTLPMLGVGWVYAVAGAEVKARAAYGRGVRPAWTAVRAHLGGSGHESGARTLDPESQSGVEAGGEVYVGRAFAFHLTAFDQSARGLIQDVAVRADTSVRGSSPGPALRWEPQNVGAISNRGWEAKASLGRGAFAVAGTMTGVRSRVRRLADGYRGDLRVGDRTLGVPARTASVVAEWGRGPWSWSSTALRAWDWINYDRLRLARDFAAGTPAPGRPVGEILRGYWRRYHGSTEIRATVSRRIGSRVQLSATGENLLGEQLGEPDNYTIRAGRSLAVGVRARF
jgi:iron complex outermembrane receptor protein